VRLTCRLTRWNVEVKSEAEFDAERGGEDVEGEEDGKALLLSEDEGQLLDGQKENSVVAEADGEEDTSSASEARPTEK